MFLYLLKFPVPLARRGGSGHWCKVMVLLCFDVSDAGGGGDGGGGGGASGVDVRGVCGSGMV